MEITCHKSPNALLLKLTGGKKLSSYDKKWVERVATYTGSGTADIADSKSIKEVKAVVACYASHFLLRDPRSYVQKESVMNQMRKKPKEFTMLSLSALRSFTCVCWFVYLLRAQMCVESLGGLIPSSLRLPTQSNKTDYTAIRSSMVSSPTDTSIILGKRVIVGVRFIDYF